MAADLPELVALQYRCFPDFVRELFMGCKSEDDLPRTVNDFRRIMSLTRTTLGSR